MIFGTMYEHGGATYEGIWVFEDLRKLPASQKYLFLEFEVVFQLFIAA